MIQGVCRPIRAVLVTSLECCWREAAAVEEVPAEVPALDPVADPGRVPEPEVREAQVVLARVSAAQAVSGPDRAMERGRVIAMEPARGGVLEQAA